MQQLYPKNPPRMEMITKVNKEKVARKVLYSEKNVKGDAIAKLG